MGLSHGKAGEMVNKGDDSGKGSMICMTGVKG